jgi:single-strand DNA-binding protein
MPSRTSTATTASSRKTKATAKVPAKTTHPEPEAPQQVQDTVLTGRLCADPKLRHTATSGKPVTTIRIAVNSGEQASFHSVVVWGRTAEVVCRYLKKGRLVEVTGRSQERTYQAEDGERRVTEIVAYQVQFLSGRTTSESQAEGERAVA